MLPPPSQQVVTSYWWWRSCCGTSWHPCSLPQPLCHCLSSPAKQDKIWFCYRGISTSSKKTNNNPWTQWTPSAICPLTLCLTPPTTGEGLCRHVPTSPRGGGVGDAPCSTGLFWLTPEEDCVGQLCFCYFLLSLSGFSLEEDCTGGTPTGKWGFFRQCADLALRWHQGQCWQSKRNYDLQDLVWTIPCHWWQEDMGEGRALSSAMCTWCSWIRNIDCCHQQYVVGTWTQTGGMWHPCKDWERAR